MEPLEIWYEIQWSYRGADDWFSTASTADSIEGARKNLLGRTPDFDYRIVKYSLSEEVVR